MIQLYNVSKSYQGDSTALQEISLKIPKGEFVYLTGPSGAGKSTLLKLLYRAEQPSRGQILINGQNLTRMSQTRVALLRRRVGVVFQDFKLLTRRTVFENVAFPLEIQGKRRYEVSKRVYQVLKQVGLEQKLNRYPLTLSGGEQQRVSVARALIIDPLILLADEPTGNLDPEVAAAIMNLLKDANARGTTVLVATHDRELLQMFPRRTLVLDQGRLAEDRNPWNSENPLS